MFKSAQAPSELNSIIMEAATLISKIHTGWRIYHQNINLPNNHQIYYVAVLLFFLIPRVST